MIERTVSLSALLLACATTASAQLISVRTVPVSQSHQFDIYPSTTMSMGGVSIAVADSLLDPFVNPAKGARLGVTRFFGSPSVYSVSNKAGGGRTLPLGAMSRSDEWFGGVWFAVQEVDLSERANGFRFPGPVAECISCTSQAELQLPAVEHSQGNTFAFVTLGRDLTENGLSVAGSFQWSRLNAVDGVDLLYARSAALEQFGHALDLRVGLLKEWAGNRSLEAIALHNRNATRHDVYYLDSFWDPGTQRFGTRSRLEQNLDRTNIWGLHLAYQQPLSPAGWRMGWIATVNRMDHPKIPNYEIMNIPRDPGHSNAFNVGFGLGRTRAMSAIGIDFIYEPIWSHTWADAAAPIETTSGTTIPKGGMTVENRFRFSNTSLRMGFDQGFEVSSSLAAGVQAGLAVHTIHYWLRQHDHVMLTSRRQEESWAEWTPTWGVSVRFPEVELRYRGSVTHGTGRPGVRPQSSNFATLDAARASTIIVAPSGPLTLNEVVVHTHQVSLSLPLR